MTKRKDNDEGLRAGSWKAAPPTGATRGDRSDGTSMSGFIVGHWEQDPDLHEDETLAPMDGGVFGLDPAAGGLPDEDAVSGAARSAAFSNGAWHAHGEQAGGDRSWSPRAARSAEEVTEAARRTIARREPEAKTRQAATNERRKLPHEWAAVSIGHGDKLGDYLPGAASSDTDDREGRSLSRDPRPEAEKRSAWRAQGELQAQAGVFALGDASPRRRRRHGKRAHTGARPQRAARLDRLRAGLARRPLTSAVGMVALGVLGERMWRAWEARS